MRSLLLAVIAILALVGIGRTAPPETRLAEGLRDHTPQVHALVGGRVVRAPGRVHETATIVVRDGRIEAIGAGIAIPPDARIWQLNGKIVYPGFVDAFGQQTLDAPSPEQGTPGWNPLITPHLDASQLYAPHPAWNEKLRQQGFVAQLVAPGAGILRGTSVLAATDDGLLATGLLKPRVALHIHLYVSRSPRRKTYPNSPMGAVAIARQTFLDAAWYRDVWRAEAESPSVPGPERNEALEALWPYLPDPRLPIPLSPDPDSDRRPLVIFDADTEQYFLRAQQFAREFGLRAVYRGSGREYRRLSEIATPGRTIVLPLAFPSPPNVASDEGVLNAEYDDLLHWHFAPENAARLERAGVRLALTTHGLKDPAEFWAAVRKAVARGWPADAALRALTSTPAELFGVRHQLGALEPGLLASFVVADGDLFTDNARVLETWIAGQRYEIVPQPAVDLRGVWNLKLGPPSAPERRPKSALKPPGVTDKLVVQFHDPPHEPKGKVRLAGKSGSGATIPLGHVLLHEERLTFTFDAKQFGQEGAARLSAVVLRAANGDLEWQGELVWPDGLCQELTAARESSAKNKPAKKFTKQPEKPSKKKPPSLGEKEPLEVNYPLGAFGRSQAGPPTGPGTVLFRRGVIWTCGPTGVLHDADVLIADGRIVAVGRGLETPRDATVIELRGRHLTPGLIDPHSHIATDGGINETGRAITCQVRIGDFIDANDVNLYRQLAGGTTTALILHGSANPIGGQCEVLKFRWGLTSEELKFREAPPTVKFALGENVTKGPDILSTRYPVSRMGVEQIFRDSFAAARDYQRRWEAWRQRTLGPSPRRDLELECLEEALAGRRLIHCHCYRQDEILAFLRVLEDFDVRVGCLHHVSEGYKIADAIRRHGAMATTFSDWWAFKVEMLDAIAYNGSFLHRLGIVTSFHSDDQELGRHLNQEAAKAMRYGQMPPEQAIQFVTLAPAKQLRIDRWVGSLEPGKHADLALWSAPPMSNFARCEQTWIDGRKYFDRDDDLAQRTQTERWKQWLVQKVLASGEPMLGIGEGYSIDKERCDRADQCCGGK